MRHTRKRIGICIGTAVAMVASLLVAVTASVPAFAAPIAYPYKNPGTDLVASYDIPFAASDVQAFATNVMAPFYGTTSVNGDVTAMMSAAYSWAMSIGMAPTSITGGPVPTQPPPLARQATSVKIVPTSTTTSTCTSTTPKETMASLGDQAGAAMAGFASGVAAYCATAFLIGMRGAYGLPYNTKYATFQSQRKGLMVATKFAGFAMFNLAFLSVSYTRLGVQLKGAIWASIIAYCILDGFLGASVDWLAAWFSSLGGSITTYLISAALNWAHSIRTWFTGPFDDPVIELTNFVQGALTYATQAALEQAELLAINPDVFAMGTGGTVYDYDLRINGSPTCAEGGGGGLQPLIAGDIVALNVCTGNPKQFWKGYNTEDCAESIWRDCWDGGDLIYFQVTLDGLCLSPVNETVNTPQRMILAWSDGSAAQLWRNSSGYGPDGGLQNKQSGLCLDVPNGSGTVGLQLDDYTCNLTDAQYWSGFGEMDPAPLKRGPITSGYSGNCLDAASGYPYPVAINSCHSGNPNQIWTTWSDNTVTAWGKCLNPSGGRTARGTPVLLNDCDGSDSQAWVQHGNLLMNELSGLCLNVPLSTPTPGTQLQIDTCNGTTGQTWILPGNTGSTGGSGIGSGTQIAVASYIYPTDAAWDRLIAASSAKESVLVANVLNGPGSEKVDAWASVIDRAHASGKKVLGYVDTGYFGLADQRRTRLGSLAPADWFTQIEADVNAWYQLYGGSMDGIFFDDGFNACGAGNVYAQWYQNLNDYAKRQHPGALTVLNPGTIVPQCYDGTADILLTFEGDYNGYVGTNPNPALNYKNLGWTPDSSQLWHIIYGASAQNVQHAVDLAEQRGAGYVEITDDVMPNPYDQLPSDAYWSAEQAAVDGGFPGINDPTDYAGSGGTPATPAGLTLSSHDYSSATLTWSTVAGASQYLIYGKGQPFAVPGTITGATIGGLTPGGNQYTFTVRAQSASGLLSSPSNAVTTTTLSLPGGKTVTNVSASASAGSTTYTADFLVPYAFHRVYVWEGTPTTHGCPSSVTAAWPVNYNPWEFVCTTYMIEGSTLFHYTGTLTGGSWPWSWTPVGSVQVNVNGYTYTWTVPIGTSTAPTTNFVIQAEGYDPLTSIFKPCPTLSGGPDGNGRYCA